MAENKTKPTAVSVAKFIKAVPDEAKRRDSEALIAMMREITKEEAVMWGPSIVGFGSYHYKYASGHEGDCCIVGFSPRKAALTLYIYSGFDEYPELMKTLGKYKASKACIYVKRLEDLHLPTLKKLLRESAKYLKKKKWP